MNMAVRGSALSCAPLFAGAVPVAAASPLFPPAIRAALREGADKPSSAIDNTHRQATEEPIIVLRQRFVELMRPRADGEIEDEEADAAEELRKESTGQKATTLAGALASLEWAREEFAGHYVEGQRKPDQMDVWALAMIDNALGVLQRTAIPQAA